jgi:hypothetical protein
MKELKENEVSVTEINRELIKAAMTARVDGDPSQSAREFRMAKISAKNLCKWMINRFKIKVVDTGEDPLELTEASLNRTNPHSQTNQSED